MQFTVYSLPLFLTAAVLLGLAFYGWRRRDVGAALAFGIAMLLCAWWALVDAFDMLTISLAGKLFWLRLRSFSTTGLPLALLAMILHFTGRASSMTRWRVAGFCVIPAITILLVWTVRGGNLLLSGLIVQSSGSFPVLRFDPGSWYWVHITYSYVLVAASLSLLIYSMVGASRLYIHQAGLVLVAIVFPLVADVLFNLGITPVRGDNLTPVAFLPMGLLLTWALFRRRVLDILPVARGLLIENMSDGVLVIDARDRIVDLNPAARHLLDLDDTHLGQNVRHALEAWSGQVMRLLEWQEYQVVLESQDDVSRYLDLRVSPVIDRRGSLLGRLLLLRDITRRQRAELELKRLKEFNENIVQQMAEGIFMDDRDGRYLFINPAGAAMLGYTPDELTGQHWRKIVPQDQWHITESANQRRRRGEIDRYEIDLLCKDGARITVQVSGMPQFDPATSEFSGTLAVHFDVTERVRAQESLQASEERHRRLVEQLAMLNDIGLAVAATLDMDRLFHTLYEQCQQIGAFDCFYVGLFDEAQGEVHFPIFYDRGELIPVPVFDVRNQHFLTCHVIRERSTLYIPDTLDIDPALDSEPAHLTDAQVRTYLAAPLLQQDRVIGIISMQSLQVNAYTAEQIRLLETVAIQAAIAIQNSQLYAQARDEIVRRRRAQESLREANKRLQAHLVEIEALQAELREQAIRDPLTNLFNRRYLQETLERELARAYRQGDPLSLAMIDIDHFKNLNDAHGHKAGDLVLRALADMLRAHSRQEDIVCRYGGEEFLVVMPGMALPSALRRAEGWRTRYETLEVEYGEVRLRSTISLGVVAFPNHGADGETLVDIVDRALYAAKTAGRNCTVVWGEQDLKGL